MKGAMFFGVSVLVVVDEEVAPCLPLPPESKLDPTAWQITVRQASVREYGQQCAC